MAQQLHHLRPPGSGFMDGLRLVASTRESTVFYVNWWLMNHCSWACSYCNEIIRKGNISLPYLSDCKQFIDEISLFAAAQNKTPRIEFTGGEVTEWTDFLELLKYAHSQGCETQFRTNGNVGMSIWQEYLLVTNNLQLEYHPEHSSAAHLLLIIHSAVNAGVSINININMLQGSWAESEALYNKIVSKWPDIRVYKRMLFQDPVFNTRPLEYTLLQQTELKRQYGDIKITEGDSVEYTDYQTMVLENSNRFKGYDCWAGLEQIVVDAWGRVYRGHCRQGGFMGNIKDKNIVWPLSPKLCTLDSCKNSFDILTTKSIKLTKI
jgi:organic radical activating enzyme